MQDRREVSPIRAAAAGLVAVFALTHVVSAANPPASSPSTSPASKPDEPAFEVKRLRKSKLQAMRVYAPDGKRFLLEKEDPKGVIQVYIGNDGSDELACITDRQQPGGPRPGRHKMQSKWHPSGRWIVMAVERDKYEKTPILGQNKDFVKGQLQCGLWTNMYMVSPDGKRWHRMTDFRDGPAGIPNGFTGPAFTPDGKKAVWSQIVDGNILAYWPFGRWELIQADFTEKAGVPSFANLKNITPKGMHWNEPGNFSPDNESLLLSGSVEKDAQGMDQYILNIRTSKLTNLTNSPTVWDEHGVFSPDGQKIIFMSAHPYRADPNSSKVLTIRTEFMLMNKDGTGLTQLSRFRTPKSPEYGEGIAACGSWHPDGRTIGLSRLIYPDYEYWEVEIAPRKNTTASK